MLPPSHTFKHRWDLSLCIFRLMYRSRCSAAAPPAAINPDRVGEAPEREQKHLSLYVDVIMRVCEHVRGPLESSQFHYKCGFAQENAN